MVEKGNPAFASLQPVRLRHEQRAFFFTGQNSGEHMLLLSRSDDQRNAGTSHYFGGLNFRGHPADGRRAVGSAGKFLNPLVNLFDGRNGFWIRIAEVFNHAINCRQYHQQIGGQQAGDELGELVVVAKLQFRKRNCVVFVDDGNDATAQQGDQCVAGVEMALMVLQVVVCEQDLSDVQSKHRKQFLVSRHQS